ncbi:LysR family transcriptional regulator [Affinibrenneria salicis]|nr:LysR family transcriptional regulator [Affinibrenneria salicis]
MDWMKTPPLYALKAFEAAARHQSFTQAAHELAITQSAVSKHIQTLEEFFDRKLFDRKGPRVILTRDGKSFAEGLQSAFSELCMACHNFSRQDITIHIKSPTTFSLRWLIAALRKLQDDINNPNVQLDNCSKCSELIDFNTEHYDGAIQYGNGMFPASWEITSLLDEWLIPVCAPGLLAQERNMSAPEIDVLYPKSREGNWLFWCKKSRYKTDLNVITHQPFDTTDLVISAAVQGLGLAIVDLNMVKTELKNHTLTLPYKIAVRTGQGYYFVRPRHQPINEKLSLLSNYLKAEIIEDRIDYVTYVT